jgi:hypothetical protein
VDVPLGDIDFQAPCSEAGSVEGFEWHAAPDLGSWDEGDERREN